MKRDVFYIICIIAIIVFFSSSLFAEYDESYYVKRGLKFAGNNNFKKAIEVYQEGLEVYPNSYELYFCIGCAYRNEDDNNRALDYLLKASNLTDELTVEFHEALARIYYAIGKERHFTRELSLRLIYHTMKLMEAHPELQEDNTWLQGLRKDVKYFDEANKGGINFTLPADAVSQRDKMLYLGRARKMAAEYEAAIQRRKEERQRQREEVLKDIQQ
ncbi:MAG: tetratricopeptide repeat protein [Candidatus Omnitrophota bacterium]